MAFDNWKHPEVLVRPGCVWVCEVYHPSVHFGWEQISQNPPAAAELVEFVPRSAVNAVM